MSRRRRLFLVLAGVVAGGAVLLALLVRAGDEAGPTDAAPSAPASESPRAQPSQTSPEPAPARTRPSCRSTAGSPFVPTGVSVPGVGGREVIGMSRVASGATGVPPVSAEGKRQFAWDAPGVRPGATRGNFLLNAHTWPDGSALGNQLLGALEEGDVIAVTGAEGQRLCYRITERVEVPFDASSARYYDAAGPAQVAIAVCSGVRLGPGVWTERTLWFGTPVAATP